MYEIREEGAVVWCKVAILPRSTAAAGAESAKAMVRSLISIVLNGTAPHSGLVYDVRGAPASFGPVTQAALENLFSTAERIAKRVAVLVGSAPALRAAFAGICGERAPSVSLITESPKLAELWVTQGKR